MAIPTKSTYGCVAIEAVVKSDGDEAKSSKLASLLFKPGPSMAFLLTSGRTVAVQGGPACRHSRRQRGRSRRQASMPLPSAVACHRSHSNYIKSRLVAPHLPAAASLSSKASATGPRADTTTARATGHPETIGVHGMSCGRCSRPAPTRRRCRRRRVSIRAARGLRPDSLRRCRGASRWAPPPAQWGPSRPAPPRYMLHAWVCTFSSLSCSLRSCCPLHQPDSYFYDADSTTLHPSEFLVGALSSFGNDIKNIFRLSHASSSTAPPTHS